MKPWEELVQNLLGRVVPQETGWRLQDRPLLLASADWAEASASTLENGQEAEAYSERTYLPQPKGTVLAAQAASLSALRL